MMKPADFFLGIRQLFGILLPGLLWILCISLVTSNKDPLEQAGHLNTAQFLILLSVSYLLGITVRRIAFRTGVGCGMLLRRVMRPVHEGDSLGRKQIKAKLIAFKKWLRETKAEAKSNSPDSPPTLQSPETASVYTRYMRVAEAQLRHAYRVSTDAPWDTMTEEDKAYIYKYIVLSPADLARKVEENEAEINLYATLVLPLAFLLVSLFNYWGDNEASTGVFRDGYRLWWVIGIVAALLANLWRVLPRRIEEAAEWYRMFIAVSLLREEPGTGGKDKAAAIGGTPIQSSNGPE